MTLKFRRHPAKIIILLALVLSFVPALAWTQLNDRDEVSIREVARAEYLRSLTRSNQRAVIDLQQRISRATSSDAQSGKIGLTLSELVQQVATSNQSILMQKTDWMISQAKEAGTRAIFEPRMTSSFGLESHEQRNSVEESLSRQLFTTFNERNWNFEAAVETLMGTGANLKLGYNLNRLSNSLTKSLTNENEEWQMYLGLSITQPLLKNAGPKATHAVIDVATQESLAAYQEYRLEKMKKVSKAVFDYWSFFQSQEKVQLRKDSLRTAEQILIDNRERQRTGMLAQTEVLEALAGVNLRKSLLNEAQHEMLKVANDLKTLSSSTTFDNSQYRAIDPPAISAPEISPYLLYKKALTLRPEYLSVQEKLKQAEIKVRFSKNQRKPELDLVASYGLNGLDFKADGAWDQIQDGEFGTWAVGMEFRQPLRGGIETRNLLKKEKLEKRRLLLALKNIEIEMNNQLETAIDKIHTAVDMFKFAREIKTIQMQLLDAELIRWQSGKGSSRSVLEKEDDFRSARENVLDSQIKLQRALTELDLAGGSILQKYGVEVMEAGL